jgi:peptide-methionine (S)-S-oxide reductase
MARASLVRALMLAVALPLAAAAQTQTAVFSGGCFWGVDAVFKHVKGVTRVVSGYSGGESSTAHYEIVSEGTTGHAESVQVTFDPSVVPYSTLLKVFFSVAHDPTELNRQGPDEGTQYRSVIFYANADQQRAAQASIVQLTQAKAYKHPIATQVVPLKAFYPAEDYHQDYLAHHLTQPYIVYNDLPKVESLKTRYPELYRP